MEAGPGLGVEGASEKENYVTISPQFVPKGFD